MTDATSGSSLPLLNDRILAELRRKPAQKAAELATKLGVERREVNRALSHTLAGLVSQDATYRWSVRGPASNQPHSVGPAPEAASEIGRLARYYLECIGQDSDEGVSVFAANRYGEPDYAELPLLPLPDASWDWWNAPGAGRVLGKVRADRNNLIAYIGYPVRLRRHRTPKWEGLFVEPVLLWPIELPASAGDGYTLAAGLPGFNFAFLRSLAMGDASQLMEEAARLGTELGLNAALEDQPEVDELLQRLSEIRPDWDWREPMDTEACSQGAPLSGLQESGIYNRAVILPGKRSPYTQGLESELKTIAGLDEKVLEGSVLGSWLSGRFAAAEVKDSDPLIEVLPMNSEQRQAIRSALTEPLTVITGPPGTGKSQVVTNLLVNAAWRGKKVLFASKNNKAVDVVEARVNGLGNRPVLLRLGSKEYQAKLASYLTAMLSGTVTQDDELSYQEGLERHRQIAARIQLLDQVQERTLAARNMVDQLDAAAEDFRVLFGAERFNALDAALLSSAANPVARYRQAIAAADQRGLGFVGRLVGALRRRSRLETLDSACRALEPLARHARCALPPLGSEPDIAVHEQAIGDLTQRVNAAIQVLKYQQALEVLRSSPAFEDIARQRQELSEQLARNSSGLWRDYVQLAPKRLSSAQRKDVSDYAALLQLITAPDAQSISQAVKNRARDLQRKVTQLFSCWAVTSLSARGKLPLEARYFDLVVIDEASQCDIASALPLLYRARRAVIIGDPMQLRHISTMTRQKESELQQKYALVDTRASWMYSINSLYDLAAGVASSENIINLRDHHRSHADIIEFSNQTFYGGRLRIATRYDALKRPRKDGPGVTWQDVKGETIRPNGSGAANPIEARAVLAALKDLLVTRKFEGSVGVVTPFRAQVQLLQQAVAADPELSVAGARCDLLVDTVHKFQGDERDVMFFSPVISKNASPGALGFLRSNGNLFNVAITRARGLLHVVGDRTAAADSGIGYLADFSKHVAQVADVRARREATQRLPEYGPQFPTVAHPERVSDWERIFYKALYAAGLRPLPQFSVEQYDLDFALFVDGRRLNIEVDGERYHRSWTGELCLRDQLRNQRLIELCWEVKRFWVYEIRDRMDECVGWVKSWAESPGASEAGSEGGSNGTR